MVDNYCLCHYLADAVVEVHLRDLRQVAAALLCGERLRDGTVAQPAKGNLFKGPFHIPRMMTKSIELAGRV